jgi:hypothetical protein
MACFTDLDYRNKSYPLLQTIQNSAAGNIAPVSYGCYDSMSDASRLYQFYAVLFGIISSRAESPVPLPITENCFVQKTEDQQLFILNETLAEVMSKIPL